MNRVLGMIAAIPMLACGAADEITPGTTAPAAEAERVLQPAYEATVGPGHVVRWFEFGPGLTVALEGRDNGQAPVLHRGQTIAGQFAAARPGEALPAPLQVLIERSEALAQVSPEELATILGASAREPQAGSDETLVEGKPDTGREGATPGLSPLVVGQQDTGADDSEFPKDFFIDWSGCQGGSSEVRRLRRTGSDDSQINEALAVYTHTASYRGNILYTIKARVDYGFWNGDWQTVLNGDLIWEGEGKAWDVQNPEGPITFWIDVKAHVREAEDNGWHSCLWEFL